MNLHCQNSEIGRLNCFFEFFAFKMQFPHILTTYNVGPTLLVQHFATHSDHFQKFVFPVLKSWHLLEARHIAALDLVKQWTTLPLYKQHCKRSHRAPKIRKWCTVLERHICRVRRVPRTTCVPCTVHFVPGSPCNAAWLRFCTPAVWHPGGSRWWLRGLGGKKLTN